LTVGTGRMGNGFIKLDDPDEKWPFGGVDYIIEDNDEPIRNYRKLKATLTIENA
jgi:hypothetical protein